MILEAVRMVHTWLQNGTYGVNAKLALMSGAGLLDGSDTVPADIVTFLEETSDARLARGRVPEVAAQLPCLAVLQSGEVVVPAVVGTTYFDADVTIGIWYVARDKDSDTGRRDAMYTIRAIRQSLHELFKPANDASRVRGAVQMFPTGEITVPPLFTIQEDVPISGAVELKVKIRDTDPD